MYEIVIPLESRPLMTSNYSVGGTSTAFVGLSSTGLPHGAKSLSPDEDGTGKLGIACHGFAAPPRWPGGEYGPADGSLTVLW